MDCSIMVHKQLLDSLDGVCLCRAVGLSKGDSDFYV